MKSAIVTGANGFIGSALCHTLIDHGISVTAVLRNEMSNISRLSGLDINIVYCNSGDILSLPDGYRKEDIEYDCFFALAWDGVSGKKRADYKMQLNNVKMMLDSVIVAQQMGCKRFVGVGSLAENDVMAYSGEDGSTPNAVSCYGAAKVSAHFMTKAECNYCGIEHLWVQLANCYGKGDKSTNFINLVIDILMTGKPADFTNGEQLYDFVNIEDVAEALFCIGNNGVNNHNYYVGSGSPRPLKEYIKIIRDIINPKLPLNLGAIPYHGISAPLETFSCEKVYKDTNFRPRVDFYEGVRERIYEYKESLKYGN